MIDVATMLLWAASLLAFLLGFLVLSQGARNQLTFRFFYFIVACSAWIASNALFVSVAADYRLAVGLLSYGAAAFLALFFYLFCRSLTESNPNSKVEKAIIVVGLFNAFVSMIPGVVGVAVNVDLSIVTHQASLLIYGCVLMVLFGAGLVVLVTNFFKAKSATQRNRIGVLIVGLVVGVGFGVGCNLILPMMGNYNYVQLGPVGSLALVAASTYAIVRHQLFDIRLAAVRGAAYLLSLATLAGLYYLLAYLASQLFANQYSELALAITPLSLSLVLVLAFLFQPLKAVFDRLTNRVFFRSTYNTEDFYAKLNQVLGGTNDFRQLLQQAAAEVARTFKADQVFFTVNYQETRRITIGTKHHTHLPADDVARINEHVLRHGDEILIAELMPAHSSKRRILVSHNISLLMPLLTNDGSILGYLALGAHQSSGYTRRDIRILSTVADELVIAIQNALSVQQIKDLNAHLEQRVDMATAKLRTSNARLRRVDTAKDEFLSMASHQLRTPLTSIKGYLSMVLEGDVGKLTAQQKQVLEEAYISSERMVHLIHDFLNVSRLQTGKFILEHATHDLERLVKEEVEALQGVAKARGIMIDYQSTGNEVLTDIDDTKLRQVVINFIDNALYYSPAKSTVEVKLRKTPGKVELTVVDAGIGVPKKEQTQLFEKFYRASNARKHRPDGTGVGLYLAKKIVMAHGGDVIFLSKEGRGSTFGFWLPLENSSKQLEDKPAK